MKYRYHEMSIIQASGQTLVKRETHLFLCVKKKKPKCYFKRNFENKVKSNCFSRNNKIDKIDRISK